MTTFRLSLTPRRSLRKKSDDGPEAGPMNTSTSPEISTKTARSPSTPHVAPSRPARAPLSPLRTNPASPRPALTSTSKVTFGPTALRSNLTPKGGSREAAGNTGNAAVASRPDATKSIVITHAPAPSCSLSSLPSINPSPTPPPPPPPKPITFKPPQLRISLPLPTPSFRSAASTPSTPGSAFSPCSFYARSPFSYASDLLGDSFEPPASGPPCGEEGRGAGAGRVEGTRRIMGGPSLVRGEKGEGRLLVVGPLTARVTTRP